MSIWPVRTSLFLRAMCLVRSVRRNGSHIILRVQGAGRTGGGRVIRRWRQVRVLSMRKFPVVLPTERMSTAITLPMLRRPERSIQPMEKRIPIMEEYGGTFNNRLTILNLKYA